MHNQNEFVEFNLENEVFKDKTEFIYTPSRLS